MAGAGGLAGVGAVLVPKACAGLGWAGLGVVGAGCLAGVGAVLLAGGCAVLGRAGGLVAGLHHCGLAGCAVVLGLHLRSQGAGRLVVGHGGGDGRALGQAVVLRRAAGGDTGCGGAGLQCAVCHGGRATAGGSAGGRNAGLQCAGGQSWWWLLIARAKQQVSTRCGGQPEKKVRAGCGGQSWWRWLIARAKYQLPTRCGGQLEQQVRAGCGGHGLRVADDQRRQAQVAARVKRGLIDHDIRHGVGWVCGGRAC